MVFTKTPEEEEQRGDSAHKILQVPEGDRCSDSDLFVSEQPSRLDELQAASLSDHLIICWSNIHLNTSTHLCQTAGEAAHSGTRSDDQMIR